MIDHFLDIIIAAVVTWVGALEIRFQLEKAKNFRLETKESDDGITKTVAEKSDAQLDAALAKHLEPGPTTSTKL